MGNHVLPKGKVNKCQFWAGVRTEKKSEQHAIARSLFAKVIKMQFVLENWAQGDGEPEVRPGKTTPDKLRKKSQRNQSGIDPNLGTQTNTSARVNAF